MDEKEESALTSNLQLLVKRLDLKDNVLDYLEEKCQISEQEAREFRDGSKGSDERNRAFVACLRRKGKNAYSHFITSLRGAHQEVNKEIAVELVKSCAPSQDVSPDGRVGEGSTRRSQPAMDVATAAVQSPDRQANPWAHKRFRTMTYKLQTKLTEIQGVRSLCRSHSLIGDHAQQELELLKIPSNHNEKLLSYLIAGGSRDAFGEFREIIRHIAQQRAHVFDDILREWDSIGPPPEEFEEFRRELG